MGLNESELSRFVAVVEAGSVAKAARELGMPRETLSRQLSRIEGRLAVRLLHRTTRKLTPTDAGQELYRRAVPIVAAIEEAAAAVRQHDGVPRGTLRVSVPAGIGSILADVIVAYQERYPQVIVQVLSTGRYVDLVAEGYDLALRAGTLRDGSLVARVLDRSRVIAVAAPAYLERHGEPTDVDQLPEHRCLAGFTPDEKPRKTWPLIAGGTVDIAPYLICNDLFVLRAAALAGHGIACLPEGIAANALGEGSLRPVLEGQVGKQTTIHLVYPERDWLPPKTRAFLDLCIERLPAAWVGQV